VNPSLDPDLLADHLEALLSFFDPKNDGIIDIYWFFSTISSYSDTNFINKTEIKLKYLLQKMKSNNSNWKKPLNERVTDSINKLIDQESFIEVVEGSLNLPLTHYEILTLSTKYTSKKGLNQLNIDAIVDHWMGLEKGILTANTSLTGSLSSISSSFQGLTSGGMGRGGAVGGAAHVPIDGKSLFKKLATFRASQEKVKANQQIQHQWKCWHENIAYSVANADSMSTSFIPHVVD
jgi:hypothetical protein